MIKQQLEEARKQLEALKEEDRKKKEQEAKEKAEAQEQEDNSTKAKAKEYAFQLYTTIPEKIKDALEKRQNEFVLYSFSVDRGQTYALYNRIVLNTLKEALKAAGVDFTSTTKERDDEEWYRGSDTFGNPSYWTEYVLIVKF